MKNKLFILTVLVFLIGVAQVQAQQVIRLYSGKAPGSEKWLEANQPVELHMYERGRHGFIMKKQNLPCDTWLERFTDWLSVQYP